MYFRYCVLAVLPATSVLASPYPAGNTACIPKWTIPGVAGSGQSWQSIPLGPGEKYCDGSGASTQSQSPPPAGGGGGQGSLGTQSSSPSVASGTTSTPTSAAGGTGGADDESTECGGVDDEAAETASAAATGQSGAPTGSSSLSTVKTGGGAPAVQKFYAQPPGSNSRLKAQSPGIIDLGSSQSSSAVSSQPSAGSQSPPPSSSSSSSSSSSGSLNGKTYQATVTAYGAGSCGTTVGSCGFLGSPSSPQAAMSVFFNSAGQPGQCGTCWALTNATVIGGSPLAVAGPLTTAKDGLVVMVDNSCARDDSKPTGGPGSNGYQCNQNAQNPRDNWGSETVVDLCADTSALQDFFGGSPGLAIATITQVDCKTSWKGTFGRSESWSTYKSAPGLVQTS